jgi:hypothetical protein
MRPGDVPSSNKLKQARSQPLHDTLLSYHFSKAQAKNSFQGMVARGTSSQVEWGESSPPHSYLFMKHH